MHSWCGAWYLCGRFDWVVRVVLSVGVLIHNAFMCAVWKICMGDLTGMFDCVCA